MPVSLGETSDEGLMALVVTGDHQAFSYLVRRHTKRFFAAAYRIVGDPTESEDIVQEAFLKLWDKPALWNPDKGAKFTTWFYRVVTNKALDAIRRRKPQSGPNVLETLPDGQDHAEDVAIQTQEGQVIESAIQSLPERQKLALNLCFYEGLSNKEAADVLDVGVKALESLLMRAKASLRTELVRKGLLEAKNAG